jgi:hypothetical protein
MGKAQRKFDKDFREALSGWSMKRASHLHHQRPPG